MPNSQPEMNDIYDLTELSQKLSTDARRVKPEEKERFVKLATRAERENWGDKYMGGEDVMPGILDLRDRLKERLAKKAA
jgi:hypothetical protein